MNVPKIEQLITKAIENRPKVLNAPMNLYIYKGNLVCGARIVMPAESAFIAHITPNHIQSGFTDKEWKQIVEKIDRTGYFDEQQDDKPVKRVSRENSMKEKFIERRREQRLRYRHPLWFGENFSAELSKGTIWDICSGGLSFTIYNDRKFVLPHNIVTRFSVPRFDCTGSVETLDFERNGRICRVEQLNNDLQKIAIQFATPLPFRPGEQGFVEDNIVSKTAAMTN